MTRTEIVKMLTENRELVVDNLNEVWRANAEDLIAAGIDAKEVAETMLCVSLTQGMKAHGPARMAEALRNQATLFDACAEAGVRMMDTGLVRLDS